MSGQLIFSEEQMLNGNIFKFEQRLHTHVNKYIEGGAILTTYFPQVENATTVDRGTRDIEQLFGNRSPLRYNMIHNLPLYNFTPANPENTDEQQIEDISVEGECIMLPTTIVPKQYDAFMINHLKMRALFLVTAVQYDSMKVDGFYKIRYRLHSTSDETIANLKKQVLREQYCDLNAIGSNVNPIIEKDDFVKRNQVIQMVNKMIESYRALFYNKRHNCFLYHNPQTGLDYFDMCGNEFMAKHGIMNPDNATSVIMLQDKLHDIQMPYFYNNSIYNWLELGAPARLLQKFHYRLNDAIGYSTSSFYRWNDGDVQIMQPLAVNEVGIYTPDSFFDEVQLNAFLDSENEPVSSEFDILLWRYINNGQHLTLKDVSLTIADTLISSIRHEDVYKFTPIAIYIIRNILNMN